MKRESIDKKQTKCSGNCKQDQRKRVYPPCRHRVHLKTPEDVRRLLSGVVNDLRQQRIDPAVAGKIVYASQTLLSVFEQNDLAAKIAELEGIMKAAGYSPR